MNLDGLPSTRSWPDVPDHERTRLLAGELRRGSTTGARAGEQVRRPGTLDELAAPPRADEPPAVDRVAALPRHRSAPARTDGRLALEDRPGAALRRLRAVAAGVVDVAAAGPRHAGARRARPRARDDGLGHPPEDVLPYLPPGGRFVRPRGRRPLRAHRAARGWSPTSSSSSSS